MSTTGVSITTKVTSPKTQVDESFEIQAQAANTTNTNTPIPKSRVIFHLMRHGFAHCNDPEVPYKFRLSTPDSPLQPAGRKQALFNRCAKSGFPLHTITHILSSPLRRALQTTLLSMSPVLAKKPLQVLAWPQLMEWNGDVPCNHGSPREMLRGFLEKEEGCEKVDMRLLSGGWESEICGNGREEREIWVRKTKKALWELEKVVLGGGGEWCGFQIDGVAPGKDAKVLVVGHSRIFGSLVGGECFNNAESKDYEFVDEGGTLVATAESQKLCFSRYVNKTCESRRRKRLEKDSDVWETWNGVLEFVILEDIEGGDVVLLEKIQEC